MFSCVCGPLAWTQATEECESIGGTLLLNPCLLGHNYHPHIGENARLQKSRLMSVVAKDSVSQGLCQL